MVVLIRTWVLLAATTACVPSFEPLEPPDDDLDGDGFAASEDCDDRDPWIHPDASDGWGDGIDANCDGGDGYDRDGDGFYGGDDCDDSDAAVYPGAEDAAYDGIDSDCDGDHYWEYDHDRDGHAALIMGGDDCDDDNPDVNPRVRETCNEIDDNCDGEIDEYGSLGAEQWYVDADADGYGIDEWQWHCKAPDEYWSQVRGDCDDTRSDVNPGGFDVCGDGVDSDCDRIVPVECGLYGRVEMDTHGIGWEIDTDGILTVLDAHIGDVTDDGVDDLTVAGRFYPEFFYIEPGPLTGGGILDYRSPYWDSTIRGYGPVEIATGDLDDDGTAELVFSVPTYGVMLIEAPLDGGGSIDEEDDLLLGNLSGEDFAHRIDIFDREGDGDDDLLVGNQESMLARTLAVFEGPITGPVTSEDASFRLESEEGWRTQHALVEDFDGTGAYGVALTGDYLEVATFSLAEDGIVDFDGWKNSAYFVAAPGDVDGDGYPDLISADVSYTHLLLGPFDDRDVWSVRDGTRIARTARGGIGGYLNDDEIPDLILDQGSGSSVYYGPFTEVGYASATLPGDAEQILDVNSDGFNDVLARDGRFVMVLWGGEGP